MAANLALLLLLVQGQNERTRLGRRVRGRGKLWRGRNDAMQGSSRLAFGAFTGPPAVCTDTCASANDGSCDDGSKIGPRAVSVIKCELGNDCSDCGDTGVRQYRPAPLSAGLKTIPTDVPPVPSSEPPVELLLKRGVKVFAARTATQPSFIMP